MQTLLHPRRVEKSFLQPVEARTQRLLDFLAFDQSYPNDLRIPFSYCTHRPISLFTLVNGRSGQGLHIVEWDFPQFELIQRIRHFSTDIPTCGLSRNRIQR